MAGHTMRKLKFILCVTVLITVSSCTGACSMAFYLATHVQCKEPPVFIEQMVIPDTESI